MPFNRQIEKAIFDAATAIEAPELRREFIDQVCGHDAEQRTRLGKLIEACGEADEFFHDAEDARTLVAADACRDLPEGAEGWHSSAPAAEEPGTRIGRYRIVRRIGEGGCGVVFLAEQEEPVRRLVALKVIRLGMDTERVIARFERERQSLALMEHPNIAHVLDAGSMENGRPYFVMEWVDGERITDYCDHNRLTLARRIDLFLEVCQAIQHAHQKGVIHRDIKPSNILVTTHDGKPLPKVIDFGIAIATGRETGPDGSLTGPDPFIGTPAYMSPELADRRIRDVDTRCDVYGLGALLHELLASRPPFDPRELAGAGLTEMLRILREREVPRPSVMFRGLDAAVAERVAHDRRTDRHHLAQNLAGDLDWIVMKAIAKDRGARYDTINGLAMDLRRFISNQPVLARPPSQVYLIGKFIRRNRLACGAAAAIAASLVIGAGLAYGAMLREREAREKQATLRQIAEKARANEARLRQSAAVRENISQVAFLVSEGKTEEADAMLRATPLAEIEPSLEAATALRALGSWNAVRGRWAEAADCYLLLTEATRFQSPEEFITQRDLISAGPVLAEKGDAENYRRFRDWVIQRLAGTTNRLACQQMMQTTLLLPADAGFLSRLAPYGAVLENLEVDVSRLPGGWEREFAGWRAWSLALYALRGGDHAAALRWGSEIPSINPDKRALAAVAHPVLAMAHHHLGNRDEARRELAAAAVLIEAAFKPDLVPAYEPMGAGQGFWWDWIQARLLFREASALLAAPQGGR